MSETQNRFKAPESALVNELVPDELVVHEPRTVAAGRGAGWLFDGFDYFKRHAGNWIAICIIGFVLMIVLNIIPVVNLLAGFLTSVWVGGIMVGCKAIYDNQGLEIGHLFAGFQNKFGSLLGLSAIVMLASFGVMAITLGSLFMAALTGDTTSMSADDVMKMALGLLIALALLLPLYMAAWFAPCLILFGGEDVFTAMKLSFVACLKNFVPFLIYGIVMIVLIFIASIPLGLGMLVVGPMIFASVFISFKEVFVD